MFNSDWKRRMDSIGRILSHKFSIHVVVDGQRCETDGNTIYLPDIPDDAPEKLKNACRGFLDHEVGHILGKTDMERYTQFDRDHGESATSIFNCLEDVRIERVMEHEYAGAGINMESGYNVMSERFNNNKERGKELSDHRQLTLALYQRGKRRPDEPFIDKDIYDLIDDQMAHIIRKAQEAPDCRAIEELALEVTNILGLERDEKFDKDKHPEPKKEPGPESPEGEPKNSEGEQGGGAGNEDKPSDQQSEGNTEGESEENTVGETVGEGAGQGEEKQDAAGEGGGSGGSSNEGGDIVKAPIERVSSEDTAGINEEIGKVVAEQTNESVNDYEGFGGDIDRIERGCFGDESRNTKAYPRKRAESVMKRTAGLKQKISQLFLSQSKIDVVRNQSRGRIDAKKLTKLATATSFNVFKRKVMSEARKTSVTIITDYSGSMQGRIEQAIDATYAVTYALDRSGIDTSVLHFSRNNMHSEISIVKRFDQTLRSAAPMLLSGSVYGGTPLTEAILIAAKKLLPRPTDRRMILAMTDGRPRHGCDPLRIETKRLAAMGVEVFLVGIQCDRVEKCHYSPKTNVINIDNVEELGTKMLKQIGKALRHG